MPNRPNKDQIEAAAKFMQKEIDPKATIERIIESDPMVMDFLASRGLIEVLEGDTNGESANPS